MLYADTIWARFCFYTLKTGQPVLHYDIILLSLLCEPIQISLEDLALRS